LPLIDCPDNFRGLFRHSSPTPFSGSQPGAAHCRRRPSSGLRCVHVRSGRMAPRLRRACSRLRGRSCLHWCWRWCSFSRGVRCIRRQRSRSSR